MSNICPISGLLVQCCLGGKQALSFQWRWCQHRSRDVSGRSNLRRCLCAYPVGDSGPKFAALFHAPASPTFSGRRHSREVIGAGIPLTVSNDKKPMARGMPVIDVEVSPAAVFFDPLRLHPDKRIGAVSHRPSNMFQSSMPRAIRGCWRCGRSTFGLGSYSAPLPVPGARP